MVNKRNKPALKAEFTVKTIEGRIRDLANRLNKLAPHPDNPNHRGPLFISLNSAFKPAAEYDGMMGSVMIEGLLGNAFGAAANDNSASTALAYARQSNLDTLAEIVSEYAEYQDGQKRGKGSFALGEHKTICNIFNEPSEAETAFIEDLTERLQLEEAIAGLTHTLNGAKRHTNTPTLQLYA